MKMDKMLLTLIVFGFVFIVLPATVFADEDTNTTVTNTTENETINVTTNTTDTNTTDTNTTIDTNTTVETNTTTNTTETNTTTNTTETNTTTNTTTNTSEEDLDDIILGNTTYGMEVRLLQLYKSLTRNIEYGEVILEEIDMQEYDVDTEELEDIMDDAYDLQEEIEDLLDEEPVNVSTEEFVALKAEAINFSQTFKRTLYDLLTNEQLNTIRDAIRDDFANESDDLSEITARIRERVRIYNCEQARLMMQKFGIDDDDFLDDLDTCNMTAKEIRNELKYMFQNMKQAQKQNAENIMNTERNQNMNALMKMSGKRNGLDSEDVEEILEDDSLTWDEKETKLRVLAQETQELQKNNSGNGNGNGNSNSDNGRSQGSQNGNSGNGNSGNGQNQGNSRMR